MAVLPLGTRVQVVHLCGQRTVHPAGCIGTVVAPPLDEDLRSETLERYTRVLIEGHGEWWFMQVPAGSLEPEIIVVSHGESSHAHWTPS